MPSPLSRFARISLASAIVVVSGACKAGGESPPDTQKVDEEILALVPATLPELGELRQGWTLPDSVTATHNDELYVLRGASAKALTAELDAQAAKHPDRQDARAYLNWRVEWSFDHVQSPVGETPTQCGITNVKVSVTTHWYGPRWEAPSDVSPQLGSDWARYDEGVRVELQAFKNHALDAAGDIYTQLPLAKPQPTCLQMDMVANGIGSRMVEIYQQRDLAFMRARRSNNKSVPWPPAK